MDRILLAEFGGTDLLEFDESGVLFTLEAPLDGLSTVLSELQFA